MEAAPESTDEPRTEAATEALRRRFTLMPHVFAHARRAGACGVLGVALLAGVKHEAIGDFVRFQIDASEATARANQVLRDIKIDPATYQHAATITYTFDGYTNEYLQRTIGIAAANRVYRDQVPSAFWTVRYFRDSQNEEYLVVLQPDGSLHSLHHTLDEKAPGANLTKEEALARAETYLARTEKNRPFGHGIWPSTQTDKQPARTDHTVRLGTKSGARCGSGPAGAHIRMQLHVQGTKSPAIACLSKFPRRGSTRKAAPPPRNSRRSSAGR